MGVIREHTSHWWLLCSVGVLSFPSPHTINVVPYYRCVGGGPELANLISETWGDVAEEATWVWAWLWSGIPRDDYASVIRDRSGPRRKDQWLPTSSKIKAYLKPLALKKKQFKLSLWACPKPVSCVQCECVYFNASGYSGPALDFWDTQRICGNRWSFPPSGVIFDPHEVHASGVWQEVKGEAMAVNEAD